jgi:hypothetical protein
MIIILTIIIHMDKYIRLRVIHYILDTSDRIGVALPPFYCTSDSVTNRVLLKMNFAMKWRIQLSIVLFHAVEVRTISVL